MSNLILDNDKSYLIYEVPDGIVSIEVCTRLDYVRNQKRYQTVFNLLPTDMIKKISMLFADNENKFTKAREELKIRGLLTPEAEAKLINDGAEEVSSKEDILFDIADSLLTVRDNKECFHIQVELMLDSLFGKTILFKEDGKEQALYWKNNIFEVLDSLTFRTILGMTLIFIYVSCRLSQVTKSVVELSWNQETGKLMLDGLSNNYIKGSELNRWWEQYCLINISIQQALQDTHLNNVLQPSIDTIQQNLNPTLKTITREG